MPLTKVAPSVFDSNTAAFSFTNAVSFSNTITVTGNATFSNTVSIPNISSNVTFANTITVTGNATFSNITIHTGNATFSNIVTFSSNTIHTGNATFSNTIAVTGAATLSNTVAVTGAATFSNTVTVNSSLKSNQFTESRSAPSISAGALTLDLSAGNIFDVSVGASITSMTFSNPPASGTAYGFTVKFTYSATAAYTATWPASVKWAGGVAPTLTATNGKTDVFIFLTVDGGTNYYGYIGGLNA
jgi:hypothetical protein